MSTSRQELFKFEFFDKASLEFFEDVIEAFKNVCQQSYTLHNSLGIYARKQITYQLEYLKKRQNIIHDFNVKLENLVKSFNPYKLYLVISVYDRLQAFITRCLAPALAEINIYSGVMNSPGFDEYVELSAKIDLTRFIMLDKFFARDNEIFAAYLEFLPQLMNLYINYNTNKNYAIQVALQNRVEYLQNENLYTAKIYQHFLHKSQPWLQELNILRQSILELCAKINKIAMSGRSEKPIYFPENDELLMRDFADSASYFAQHDIKTVLQERQELLKKDYVYWSKFTQFNINFFNPSPLAVTMAMTPPATGYKP